MTNKTLEDFGRRNINFNNSKVSEVLPSYFKSEHPDFINFLEKYYEFMDSDEGINDKLDNIQNTRDIVSVSDDFLNSILFEIGKGITADRFENPRVVTRNFPEFFRYKGTKFSAQSFFRSLYGEEAEITYPKDQLFIVGESQIGPDSLKIIQDGNLYQTLSVLIKSSQPISQWRELYKQYVHPAGFYLGGEVLVEDVVDLNLSFMPDAIEDSSASEIVISDVANVEINAPIDPISVLVSSPNSETLYRVNVNKTSESFDSFTVDNIERQYPTAFSASTSNPFDFSDSNDIGIDFSNVIETLDQSNFDSNGV